LRSSPSSASKSSALVLSLRSLFLVALAIMTFLISSEIARTWFSSRRRPESYSMNDINEEFNKTGSKTFSVKRIVKNQYTDKNRTVFFLSKT
jgi:hypothetical protein